MKPDVVPENLKNPINYKILALIFGSVLTFQSILYFVPESEKYELIISIISFVNPLATSIASFVIWKRYGGTLVFGRSYFFLGMAYFMVFAAELTYLIYDLVLNIDPYPSIADVFFFALYPFTLIHLILNIKFFKLKIYFTVAAYFEYYNYMSKQKILYFDYSTYVLFHFRWCMHVSYLYH